MAYTDYKLLFYNFVSITEISNLNLSQKEIWKRVKIDVGKEN